MDIFPEGDSSSSPGLLYSATLGKSASTFRNPNGVAALFCVKGAMNSLAITIREKLIRLAFTQVTTPLGLVNSPTAFPKVAEYSNLGLWVSTTSWLFALRQEGHV